MSRGHKGEPAEHLRPMLDALRADPAKLLYYKALLAPLLRYDAERHGDLITTVDEYIKHGGNASQTAEALFLHRNSLRYRLARIRALTGLDIDDPAVRLALQVAVLVLDLPTQDEEQSD